MIKILIAQIRADGFIPVIVLWLVIIPAIIAAWPAHAATHPDKPVQETSPVATKQSCARYVVASVVYVGKDGKLHTAIVMAPACGN
jgi:hypothetical protein